MEIKPMTAAGLAWSTEEKRLRLFRGDPLEFDPPPADGNEAWEGWVARAARTIPAAWLEELAARPARVVGVPIKVSNAIVEGPLDLTYATFAYEVAITDSEFTGDVDFSFASFQRVIVLDGARFQGKATFRAARAAYDFRAKRAHFAGETSFNDLQVDQDLDASGAHFDKDANFQAIKVDGTARFSDDLGSRAHFRGQSKFLRAHIKGDAEFTGVQFEGDADFERVQVDGNAFFRPDSQDNPARFKGNMRFMAAHIGVNAEFDGAQFEGAATFEGLRVGMYALFRAERQDNPVCFGGEFDFRFAHIGVGAQFTRAQFAKAATFDFIQLEGSAIFTGADFNGGASFQHAHFAASVYFLATQFKGDADFATAVADRSVDFRGAVFSKKATFFDAHFRVARCRDELTRKLPEGATEQFVGTVDLRGFTYERIDVAWGELFDKEKLAPYDRQPYTQIETVLRATGEDRNADQVYLARRAYERRGIWKQWERRPLVDSLLSGLVVACVLAVVFSRSSAGTRPLVLFLISFALVVGLNFADLLNALFDTIYWIVAHYGVRPHRLLVLTVGLLIMGTVIFSGSRAVIPRSELRQVVDFSGPQVVIRHDEPRTLNEPIEAVGVSLSVLLPLELPPGAGGEWQPSDCYIRLGGAADCQPTVTPTITYSAYGTIQRLFGWILVPLGIAALAGLLSRRPPGGPEQRGASGEG